MVTRALLKVARAVLAAAPLFAVTSCAAVWGFDPLSLAPDDADDASVSDAGDASADGRVEIDGACATCGADASTPSSLVCLASNGSCSCAVNPPGNGLACSPSSLGVDPASVICCADPSYPTNGSCMCNWIGCATSSGTCICGPSNATPGGSCAPSSWTCCIQNGAPQCVCSASACLSGFTPFGNACGVADVKCGGAQRKVESCNK